MIKKLYSFGKILLSSAPFALLLSLVLFWVEQVENQEHTGKMLSEMTHIESSLSTRHIGIFPNFIGDINTKILKPDLENDSIIIFEDVLFYGAFSNPSGFATMTSRLLDFADKGNNVTIAFYDNQGNHRNKLMFVNAVKEMWMSSEYLFEIPNAYDKKFREYAARNNNTRRFNPGVRDSIRSLVDEEYFLKSKQNKASGFNAHVDRVKKANLANSLTKLTQYRPIFERLDSIKAFYLDKPYTDIKYSDVYGMYDDLTNSLRKEFEERRVKLVPMHSPLMLSCWANSSDAIFAMPGRFAADEIGFITHDLQILRYFRTLIDGIEHEENYNSTISD